MAGRLLLLFSLPGRISVVSKMCKVVTPLPLRPNGTPLSVAAEARRTANGTRDLHESSHINAGTILDCLSWERPSLLRLSWYGLRCKILPCVPCVWRRDTSPMTPNLVEETN